MFAAVGRSMPLIVATAATAVGVATAIPHTIMLHKYQNFLQRYKDGYPEDITPEVKELTEEVLFDVNMPPYYEVVVSFFPTSGLDILHAGCVSLTTGCVIGIPCHFSHNHASDIIKEPILIGNRHVNWSSEEGQKLLSSLLLSKNAKMFAIARELFYAQTNSVMVKTVGTTSAIAGSYGVGYMISNRLLFRLRLKLWARLGFYTLIGALGYTLYVMLQDSYYVSRDRSVDKKVVKLGEKYVKGGVEFYEKLLQQNQSLRAMLPNGSEVYTAAGNKVENFRVSQEQLTARRKKMLKYLEDL